MGPVAHLQLQALMMFVGETSRMPLMLGHQVLMAKGTQLLGTLALMVRMQNDIASGVVLNGNL